MPATLKTTRSQIDTRKSMNESNIKIFIFPFLVNNISSQNHSPITPLVISTFRSERFLSKIPRVNSPTVNSLLHLYGSWTFDCCLLQIKDRHSRSSINDGKSLKSYVNKITRMINLIHLL
jgi:hypothetical protein